MDKKKFFFLLISLVIVLAALIFWDREIRTNNSTNEITKTINGEGVFPYKQNISSKIGILDTGISLENKFLPNEQIKQTSINSYQKSEQIHGTMITGILISNGTWSSEPHGLIPNSNIFSIQTGNDFGTTSDQLANAINLAIENDVDILNISMATPKNTKILQQAIKKAIEKNIVIIASTGNDGTEESYFPANYKNVISVGGISAEGNIIGNTNVNTVDIFALGEDILTTIPGEDEKANIAPGNSGAVPIVTAAVAVLLNEYPNLEPEQIKKILKSSSTIKKIENEKKINILNVKNMLKEANNITN